MYMVLSLDEQRLLLRVVGTPLVTGSAKEKKSADSYGSKWMFKIMTVTFL